MHADEAWPTPQTPHSMQFCISAGRTTKQLQMLSTSLSVCLSVCLSVYLTYLGQAVQKQQHCSE